MNADTSTVKVGDEDPFPHTPPYRWCLVRFAQGWVCSAPVGHVGTRHIACGLGRNGSRVMAVSRP